MKLPIKPEFWVMRARTLASIGFGIRATQELTAILPLTTEQAAKLITDDAYLMASDDECTVEYIERVAEHTPRKIEKRGDESGKEEGNQEETKAG